LAKEYICIDDCGVAAVQLHLDTEGFEYEKWGGTQKCKRDDWMIKSLLNDETYTVAEEYFRANYKYYSPGFYKKRSIIYAREAEEDGAVPTLEGKTSYKKGDYIVLS